MRRKLRCYLVWAAVIAALIILPRHIYRALKSYWYQRRGLCFAIPLNSFFPSGYTPEKASLAVPELKKSTACYYPAWESHFLLGMAYAQLKDYANAEEAYLTSLRFNPNYAKTYYNLGNIYYHTARYTKAVEHYRAALELDPAFISAQNNLQAAEKMSGRTKRRNFYLR